MNAVKEAGKVANNAIDAFRANPLCLAVVVLSIVMTSFAYFSLQNAEARKAVIVTDLLKRCFPLQDNEKE